MIALACCTWGNARANASACAATFPRANFDILAKAGLIGLTVDPKLGGAGAGRVDCWSTIARSAGSTAT